MIKIGITTRPDDSAQAKIKDQYIEFLKDTLFEIIPLDYNDEHLYDKVPICDGFIIPGGQDINPMFYDEVNTNSVCYPIAVDLMDKYVIEYAYNNNLPLLGICRGMQALNAFLGGTLHQHIDNHKDTEHLATFNNTYANIIDLPNEFKVNSIHHQSVDKLSDRLTVICSSVDGVCEGVTCIGKPIMGFQWHPELMNNNETKIILEWFKRCF